MNTKCRSVCSRGELLAAVLLLALCGGCLEKRFVWAPDGSRAAVIGDGGLYLCDAEGHLSGLLAPQVYAVAWFNDSRRLVLARTRETSDWDTIAPTLGSERAGIEARADALWTDLAAGKPWGIVTLDLHGGKGLVQVCLRHRHGDGVRAKLDPAEWKALTDTSVELSEVVVARTENGKVEVESIRDTGYGKIQDLRVSPTGDAVMVTRDMVSSDDVETLVLSLRSEGPAVRIAARTAAFPDWAVDGRSVLYVEASAGAADDALELGVLTKRSVLDNEGRVAVAERPDYLAGLMFNRLTHVRCLRDGRILFNAVEISLPLAAADYGGDQREQLFALDVTRQSTLVRLIPRKHELDIPQMLGFFEVSPDERQIVIEGVKGEICILTLATGEVKQVQDRAEENYQGLPAWRGPGEFTYVRRSERKEGQKPARPAEVVLRRGDKETVLSQSWADDVLASIAKNYSK